MKNVVFSLIVMVGIFSSVAQDKGNEPTYSDQESAAQVCMQLSCGPVRCKNSIGVSIGTLMAWFIQQEALLCNPSDCEMTPWLGPVTPADM